MSSRTKSPFMTVAEAAEYLGVTEHTVHRWARKGPDQKLHKKRAGGWGVRLLRSEVYGLIQDDEDDAPA